MKEMTKEERDAVLKDIPIHKEVPHPEGVDISDTEANLGWGTQRVAEEDDQLERKATSPPSGET